MPGLDFLGSIIGAGANLASSLMGENQRENEAAQAQANFNQQFQWQQTLARSGLMLKAQDATDAEAITGINRLALLGQSGPSYSPISVGGGGGGDFSGIGRAGELLGKGISGLEEDSAEKKVSDALDLENKKLRNDFLRAQIERLVNPGAPRALNPNQTIDGQGDQGSIFVKGAGALDLIKVDPQKVHPGSVYDLGVMPGMSPDVEYGVGAGRTGLVQMPQEKSLLAISYPRMLQEAYRNVGEPAYYTAKKYLGFGDGVIPGAPPPDSNRPSMDHFWGYNPFAGRYEWMRKGRGKWIWE